MTTTETLERGSTDGSGMRRSSTIIRKARPVVPTMELKVSPEAAEEVETMKEWLVKLGSANKPLEVPESYRLDPGHTWVLGRSDPAFSEDENRFETEDGWMSGSHAEIKFVEDEGWVLRDLGSSNGTWAEGKQIPSMNLSDGEVFATGETFWMFRRQKVLEVPSIIKENGRLGSMSDRYMQAVVLAQKVARRKVSALILGETGTGKELFAREIHDASGRPGDFAALNVGGLAQTLIAAELFGAEKGAHSTAEESKLGNIRASDKGTLFLDEIGRMPEECQCALLRVLQEEEVKPVGGHEAIPVDLRAVSATNENLNALILGGTFRLDLYQRLRGCTIEIPALRERMEDIGLLVARFVEKFAGDEESIEFRFEAYAALWSYDWPGNVRELENVVSTAVAVCENGVVELRHLSEEVQSAYKATKNRNREVSVDEEILRALEVKKGNVAAAARMVGASRMQVYRRLEALGIDPDEYRN